MFSQIADLTMVFDTEWQKVNYTVRQNSSFRRAKEGPWAPESLSFVAQSPSSGKVEGMNHPSICHI